MSQPCAHTCLCVIASTVIAAAALCPFVARHHRGRSIQHNPCMHTVTVCLWSIHIFKPCVPLCTPPSCAQAPACQLLSAVYCTYVGSGEQPNSLSRSDAYLALRVCVAHPQPPQPNKKPRSWVCPGVGHCSWVFIQQKHRSAAVDQLPGSILTVSRSSLSFRVVRQFVGDVRKTA
jgi:hypothetical protein